jgi:transposase
VIDMALLSVIRRWHFREGMPIREIERRTGLSRNTIRKYLRADTVEPKFKVPGRPSKLDPFAEKLSGWLRIEAGKSRKQRRTAKQMHADLVVLGYDGSYERVAAFVRMWKAERQRELQTSGRGTFVPLVFAPGEAFQFDWSEDWALIAGKQVKLQAAHTKLSHSKAFIVRAYPLQTHEMLFDALTQAFRVLGGVPQRGIFDNMKTAVDKIGTGKARQVNARFAAMASHYLFEPEFCNPASGWEKGQVEKNVQDARRRLWQAMPGFPDIDALNAWLEAQCIAQWGQIQHDALPGTVADVHAGEVASLMPMGRPFAEMPAAFRQLQGQLLRHPGGDREMAEILALVLQHDEQAVLCAVELALEAGVATKTHILNILYRLTDGKAPPASPIDAPQALRLGQEPVANVGCYDDLRELRHAS